MGLFKVKEDVVNLLRHHLAAVLPVLVRGSEPPHVDPVGAVYVFTPPPGGTRGCHCHRISGNVVFHVPQCHLQKETNSTDVSDDASVVSNASILPSSSISKDIVLKAACCKNRLLS